MDLWVVTEVRQDCESPDLEDGEGPCSDCTEAVSLCSGSGNQWSEFSNMRYPGGEILNSLDAVLSRLKDTQRETRQ
jgi:hypothetical protein